MKSKACQSHVGCVWASQSPFVSFLFSHHDVQPASNQLTRHQVFLALKSLSSGHNNRKLRDRDSTKFCSSIAVLIVHTKCPMISPKGGGWARPLGYRQDLQLTLFIQGSQDSFPGSLHQHLPKRMAASPLRLAVSLHLPAPE